MALLPPRSVAATVMTPGQFAGWKVVMLRLLLLFPTAATMIPPAARMAEMADW
jgi:hypothetical protein